MVMRPVVWAAGLLFTFICEYTPAIVADEMKQPLLTTSRRRAGTRKVSKTTKASSNPCASSPCARGGTCHRLGNVFRAKSYRCSCPRGLDPRLNCNKECPAGTFGKGCAKRCSGCSTLYCLPTSGCSRCYSGFWNKPKCDKIDCAINPCMNGADCNQKKHKCDCLIGFSGRRCDIAPQNGSMERCRPYFCNYEGECYELNGKRGCHCEPPYIGRFCKDKKCKSHSNNCVHGKCFKAPYSKHFEGRDGQVHCVCYPGYQPGKYCDKPCVDSYGQNCISVCGNCRVQPCDHINGSCGAAGCLGNYRPPECKLPFINSDIRRPIGRYSTRLRLRTNSSLNDVGDMELQTLKNDVKKWEEYAFRQAAYYYIKMGPVTLNDSANVDDFLQDDSVQESVVKRDGCVTELCGKPKKRQIQNSIEALTVVDITKNNGDDSDVARTLQQSLVDNVDAFTPTGTGDFAIDRNSITVKEMGFIRSSPTRNDKDPSTTTFLVVALVSLGILGVVITLALLNISRLNKRIARATSKYSHRFSSHRQGTSS